MLKLKEKLNKKIEKEKNVKSKILDFSKIDLMTIFTFIVLASLVFTIVYNIILGGKYLRSDTTHFTLIWDYLLHVYGMSDKSVYPNYVMIFPPFAYLIYYLFYRSDATIPAGTDYLSVEERPIALDTYHIYYFAVIVIFILYALLLNEVFKKVKIGKRILFIFSIILSYPVYYMCVYSGNEVLAVVLILLTAMLILDNDNVTEKQKIVAMILIAITSGLKIVPAIFGLEFLRKKDYKNALILIAMGIAIFVLPFFFFEGFKTMVEYIQRVIDMNELANPINTSIWYIPEWIMKKVGIDTVKYSISFVFMKIIFLIVNLFLYFKARKSWQRFIILGFICAQYISRSYNYYLSYYVVGLVFLFKDENLTLKECSEKGKGLYLLLILLFSATFALYFIEFKEPIHFAFSFLAILVVYAMIVLDIIKRV